jgi:hypothetical protein
MEFPKGSWWCENKENWLMTWILECLDLISGTVDFLLKMSCDVLYQLSVKTEIYLSIITTVSYLIKIVLDF